MPENLSRVVGASPPASCRQLAPSTGGPGRDSVARQGRCACLLLALWHVALGAVSRAAALRLVAVGGGGN